MLIAQITDIHIGFDRGNPDEHNMQRLKAVLRRLIDGPNRPDLMVMSGDLTEFGDRESYERLAEAVSICPFPVLPMTGNHDLREPLLAAFPQTRSEDGFVHYGVDCGDFRLLLLDTLEDGRHGGGFCETRARWLDAQLSAEPEKPVVIAMHHPPFEAGISWLDSSAREPWIRNFTAALAGHSQVRAIVSGHLHRNIHTLWNGVSLSVSTSVAPAVGLDLNPIDIHKPDGRAMITDELAGYALHRWDGERLIAHFESVGALRVLARYDKAMQTIVQLIDSEKPKD